jgi:hypothetical protein
MIKIDITEEQILQARKLYNFKALTNSITQGESQIYGALGEVIAMHFLRSINKPVQYVGSYDYDLEINGKKIDVKTIQTDKEPTNDFNANIDASNTRQKTDFYLWCSVSKSMKYGYIIGYLAKDEFYKISQLKKKGEIDWGDWVFKSDTYTTKVKNVKKFT